MRFNIWENYDYMELPDVLSFIVDNRGKTVPTDVNGNHILIATNCIRNENLYPSYDKVRMLNEEVYQNWFRAHPKPGDIIFVNKGTPGRVCMVPDPVDFCIAQDMMAFRVNTEIIYNKYLLAVLRNPRIQNQIAATTVGDVIPHFKKQQLHEIKIPIPPMKIQKIIGDYYFILCEKVILNNKINNNLLEQLNQLFIEFSTRCEWNYLSIGEIAEKVAMGPFGSNIKVSTFVESGVPIISGNHLRGYFLEEPSYNYITEAHADKLKNSIVYPKDIVFTHAGNIGQVAMIPDGCEYPYYVLSQRQFYLRCNTMMVAPEYVLLFFHSKQGQHELLSYANQTGVPSIAQPASNLKKICLPIPPISEQKKWLLVVEPIIAMYQNNYQETKRLSILRDTLLPKLMSGDLDVSNIDI